MLFELYALTLALSKSDPTQHLLQPAGRRCKLMGKQRWRKKRNRGWLHIIAIPLGSGSYSKWVGGPDVARGTSLEVPSLAI